MSEQGEVLEKESTSPHEAQPARRSSRRKRKVRNWGHNPSKLKKKEGAKKVDKSPAVVTGVTSTDHSDELIRIKCEPKEFTELDKLLETYEAPPKCSEEGCGRCSQIQIAFCFMQFHDCKFNYVLHKRCLVCSTVSPFLVENSTHSGCQEIACVFCKGSFETAEELRSHVCLNLSEKNYNCQHCSYSSDQLDEFFRHILHEHCGVEHLQCSQCSETWPDRLALDSHVASAHPTPEQQRRASTGTENPPVTTEDNPPKKRRKTAPDEPDFLAKYKTHTRPTIFDDKLLAGARRDFNLPSILKRDKKSQPEPFPETIRLDAGDEEIPRLVKISENKGTGSKLYRYVSGGSANERVYEVVPHNELRALQDDDDYSDSDMSDKSSDYPLKISREPVCRSETCSTCFDRQAALCMLEFHHCPVPEVEDSLVCLVCTQVASHIRLIAKDSTVHAGGTIIRCVFCYTIFKDMTALKEHICSADQELRCLQCGVIQDSLAKLCTHLFYHFRIMGFTCNKCGKSFVTERNYASHQREHALVPKLACTYCDRKFFKTRELQNHLYRHGVKKPYACNKCDRSFAAHYQLLLHLQTHETIRAYKCTKCPRSFIKPRALQHHEYTFHNTDGYQCEICSRVMSTPMRLRNHMKCHEFDRPYKCDMCGHGYANKGSLNRHMRVHTNQVLACDFPYCTYTTHYDFQLRTHKYNHAPQKPFSCSKCYDVAFVTKRSLVKHFDKIHGGEDFSVISEMPPITSQSPSEAGPDSPTGSDNNSMSDDEESLGTRQLRPKIEIIEGDVKAEPHGKSADELNKDAIDVNDGSDNDEPSKVGSVKNKENTAKKDKSGKGAVKNKGGENESQADKGQKAKSVKNEKSAVGEGSKSGDDESSGGKEKELIVLGGKVTNGVSAKRAENKIRLPQTGLRKIKLGKHHPIVLPGSIIFPRRSKGGELASDEAEFVYTNSKNNIVKHPNGSMKKKHIITADQMISRVVPIDPYSNRIIKRMPRVISPAKVKPAPPKLLSASKISLLKNTKPVVVIKKSELKATIDAPSLQIVGVSTTPATAAKRDPFKTVSRIVNIQNDFNSRRKLQLKPVTDKKLTHFLREKMNAVQMEESMEYLDEDADIVEEHLASNKGGDEVEIRPVPKSVLQ